ncbi:MAG TPA: hypothetical protein VMG34_09120 [Bacteroidota bacterium]|nr:hypothetical protein [Bacteroidota bacterium]
MILVREVFQLKFGKAKEAKAAWKEGAAILQRHNLPVGRALTDLVGPYYTFVLENTHNDLASFESSMKSNLAMKEFGQWYQEKFSPLVESGMREIFTIVE